MKNLTLDILEQPQSYLIVEIIPYRTFKEKIKIVSDELNKNRNVEIWDKLKLIYSVEKLKHE